jgi:hypothetical protein
MAPAGAQVPPRGAEVPPQVPPGGAEVPPDETLNIIEVQGRGHMKAPKGLNGTIVMVLVDPMALRE